MVALAPMKISHGVQPGGIEVACGYGYATDRMIWALGELGHEIAPNDPTAPVQIWFDQPQHWKWNEHQYNIGYLPWESTKLRPGWVEMMNRCDEIWTPSPMVAHWYRADGVTTPVYTYEHGVDKVWSAVDRQVNDTFRFLHVGGEAVRKGAFDTLDAFRAAFPKRDDVELTLKMISRGWNVPLTGRVKWHKDILPLNEHVRLYHDHHAFIYPSWGEGFGLTPLEAMATGMPTITVPAWAPYEVFLDPRLRISSKLVDSPWPKIHPGKMFQPSLDETVDRMRWVVDNYETAKGYAMTTVPNLRANYDWLELTKEAFDNLAIRLEKSPKSVAL